MYAAPSFARTAWAIAVAGFGLCATGGCRRRPQPPPRSVDGGPAVKPLEPPRARPARLRSIGHARWLTLAVRGELLAATTPRTVRLLALPSRKVLWERPAPVRSLHTAFSADGKRVAVLGRSESDVLLLRVLDTATGNKVREDRYEGLPSPSRSRGRQPPAWPLYLAPAPKAGWWIRNAYGVWAALPGKTKVDPVEHKPVLNRFRMSQDAPIPWSARGNALVSPGKTLPAPCYAQNFAVSAARDSAGIVCATSGRTGAELIVLELSTGKERFRRRLRGIPSALAITGPDEVVALFEPAPIVGWFKGAKGVRWQAMADRWKRIEISPGGAHAVGMSKFGAFQVLSLPSGAVHCDHARLPAVAAIGFADDKQGYALMRRKQRWLDVVSLDLRRCKAGTAKPTRVTTTTWIVPVWLRAGRSFVLNGSYKGGYGSVLLRVDTPTEYATLGRLSYGLEANERGDRVAVTRSPGVAVFGAKGRRVVSAGQANKVAFCGDRILTYTYRGGWVVHDARGKKARFRLPTYIQPDVHDCRKDTLVVFRSGRLYVFDLKSRTIRAHFKVPGESHETSALQVLPGEKQVLAAGGRTGWRIIELSPTE